MSPFILFWHSVTRAIFENSKIRFIGSTILLRKIFTKVLFVCFFSCQLWKYSATHVKSQSRCPFSPVQGGSGQDRDILPQMPCIQYIGYRSLPLWHCIQPHILNLSPDVHSVLSRGGSGQDRTGTSCLRYHIHSILAIGVCLCDTVFSHTC